MSDSVTVGREEQLGEVGGPDPPPPSPTLPLLTPTIMMLTIKKKKKKKNNDYSGIPSSNGNSFRVTGPLWWKSTSDRWIPFTKASGAELGAFFDLRLTKRDTSDLRRHGAHYDVTVMVIATMIAMMVTTTYDCTISHQCYGHWYLL